MWEVQKTQEQFGARPSTYRDVGNAENAGAISGHGHRHTGSCLFVTYRPSMDIVTPAPASL